MAARGGREFAGASDVCTRPAPSSSSEGISPSTTCASASREMVGHLLTDGQAFAQRRSRTSFAFGREASGAGICFAVGNPGLAAGTVSHDTRVEYLRSSARVPCSSPHIAGGLVVLPNHLTALGSGGPGSSGVSPRAGGAA